MHDITEKIGNKSWKADYEQSEINNEKINYGTHT